MSLIVTSPAFGNGATIPLKHTRDGGNVSPLLRWTGAPKGARSFALIVEDPDAPHGTFRHWAAFDIPPDRDNLPEACKRRPNGRACDNATTISAMSDTTAPRRRAAMKRFGDSPASIFSKRRVGAYQR
jgi:Raf kinase inhibitor-like YbhB/YbcL family protein